MGNVLFIVWRESVEAMLVIGILYVWLRNQDAGRTGLRYLWGGVAAGVVSAVALGAGIMVFADFFSGDAQEYFHLGMVLVAAALIVQMVLWMRKHGRTLKKDLESGLSKNVAQANWWGVFTLTLLAVAREGSESVIFLYGTGLGQQGIAFAEFAGVALVGFLLALGTFWLLQLGGKIFNWRVFFRVTEILLLLLAGAMLMTGVDKLMSLEWLPPLYDQIWDTRFILDDSNKFGGVIAALTGYRAQPALTSLLVLAAYWALMLWLIRPRTTKPLVSA